MTAITKTEALNKIYTAQNHEDLMEAYKVWAGDYDGDTVGEFGYVAPMSAGAMLDSYLESKNSKILDAGCGTGLAGEVLHEIGYKNIDALDYSQEMLDVAAEKGIFDALIQADMTKTLDIPTNTYDGIICVGTFTYAHVKGDAFKELIRITKPEGYITFTIRDGAFEDYNYRRDMVALECDDAWELQEMRREDYLRNEGVQCKLCTYKVPASS